MEEQEIILEETGDVVVDETSATPPEPFNEIGTVIETVEHPQESTMPQLDADHFSSQLFWLVITFVFLWIVLSRRLLPEIHTILENRQTKIRHDLDRAEKLQAEATGAQETYERALRDSRAKAQALINESTALMDKSSTARHAELDRKLDKQLADAEANIRAAKAQALTRLSPVSKELTQEIVEKLTGKKVSVSKVGEIVDALVKEKHYG